MKNYFVTFLLLVAASLPLRAHFVWIERDASGGTAAYFGEWAANVRETEEGYLKLIAKPKAFAADGKELAVTRANDRINIAAGGVAGDVRLTNTYFGEKAKSVSFYQAKLGRTETAGKFELELVPVAADSNRFTLLLHGAPLADADVVLFTSSGWSRTWKTDAAGKVTIETPWPGQAVIEVGHLEKKAGELDGRAYEGVRHVFTLTFDVKS
ncbi:hypothetical protein CMV30_03510 [Nibricoccus aquaticus]|uniref:DUF4198 domain-containing protein n=1 Tax=Nibricoccus aquaticus TaxID=2576891 RepID=A0A290Q476_9BACT|nr:hypothetical protein [Nibricoccus aquaticus]ATC63097.1 hypothetical protein CMV30_03510 [Nibricoccus aquaticus]